VTSSRVLLLAGQAFALGLTTAWVLIPASTLFLEDYGSDRLPLTYIGAGVAGIASSAALSGSLRRRPIAAVATRVVAGVTVALVVAWCLLAGLDAAWVTFVLLVVVPLLIPTGFVFVVGQAGLLLDVRALKASYARVVAGFASGFVTGGLVAPWLLGALGGTQHLLAAAAAAGSLFLALLVVTRRAFPVELAAHGDDPDAAAAPTVRDLLRDRFVALLVAFQVLSAVESQWLDFLVFDRAARRYEDTEELARFVSQFTAIAYGADIVFLVLVAGVLLRRFGLGYGLTANSLAVLTVLVSVVAASVAAGSAATVVFVLVVAARVTDLVCSDGTSRTSLSAAYQVVVPRLRVAAPARVEGLAVPVAIAASGAVLLLLGATTGTAGLHLPVLTMGVVAVWVAVAVRLYRSYRSSLLERLRHRELEPSALVLEGGRDVDVVTAMVERGDEREVRLALDLLAESGHPALIGHLHRLAADPRPGVRAAALARLVGSDPGPAAVVARAALADEAPVVVAAAATLLGAVGGPADRARVAALTTHVDGEVRVAAAVATTALGDDVAVAEVSQEVGRLARSTAAPDRLAAARVLGACPDGRVDRSPLVSLVQDADPEVAASALDALRWPDDRAVLDVADMALATAGQGGADRRASTTWVRVCRALGPAAAPVLLGHAHHPDRDVGLSVLTALGAPGIGGADGVAQLRGSPVVRDDLAHAVRLLLVLGTIDGDRAGPLRAALGDELDLVRRRVLAALAAGYGAEGVRRAEHQLAQPDARAIALALEWLDVTLVGSDRGALALLEPGLSDDRRLAALQRALPTVVPGRDLALRDLVEDAERHWRRPWVAACALHLAWQRGRADPVDPDEAWIGSLLDGDRSEGGDILAETAAGLARRAASRTER
jgi:hypothetical protein